MAVAALLHQGPAVPQAIQRVRALPSPGFGDLLLQGAALLPCLRQAAFHFLYAADGVFHLGEEFFRLRDLILQSGQDSLVVVAALVLPVLQFFGRLGIGNLFIAAGDDGLNPLLQLGIAGDGDIPLADEGAAAEDIAVDAGQQFSAIGPGHALHGRIGTAVDRGEFTHRGIAGDGCPGQRHVAAVRRDVHRPFHRCPGPGGIARPVGKSGLLRGIDPVEHGPDKGTPGALSALIGRVDDVQTPVER